MARHSAIVLVLCMMVACSGRAQEAHPGLGRIAEAIAHASPLEDNPLGLEIEVVETHGKTSMRCALTNISSGPLKLQKASLPCAGWWSLTVTGLTTDGRVLLMAPQAGSILSAVPPPEVTIAPHETVRGEMNLQSVYPLTQNPRTTDALLLWLYSHDRQVITGIALLPKRN
jgi:hypothetical protein